MDDSSLWIATFALICGVFSVIAVAVSAGVWLRGQRSTMPAAVTENRQRQIPTVFLFRDDELIDASEPARHWFAQSGLPGNEFQQLQVWIEEHFPKIGNLASRSANRDRTEMTARVDAEGGEIRLIVEYPGIDRMRVTLEPVNPVGVESSDILARRSMEEELTLLRHAFNNTPTLFWRQDGMGRIIWANATYLELVRKVTGDELAWPLPQLLKMPEDEAEEFRAMLVTEEETLWFDCRSKNVGQDTMFYAVPADAAVRAERFLREFVQTLTRTFATLSTGFAIFDRQRNLQLFNPAIIDLTGLTPEFLAARPTLEDFLDQLRELRMVPEPKDYPSWRRQIANLESAASAGHHVEEWSLPGGRVFRVQGSPHPDGAIAFLFEDITSEISIRREYWEELALNKAALDQIDDALTVFGADGKVALSNRSYREYWGGEAQTVQDAIRIWQNRAVAGPEFDALCKALVDPEIEGSQIGGWISVSNDQRIGWRISHISGERRLVRFHTTGDHTVKSRDLPQ